MRSRSASVSNGGGLDDQPICGVRAGKGAFRSNGVAFSISCEHEVIDSIN